MQKKKNAELLVPSIELIKINLLHRAPQVRFTWRAFFWWFLGFVIIQHKTRTSLYSCWAIVVFSCAWAASSKLCDPTSCSGPSANINSPPVCGSLKSTRRASLLNAIQNVFVSDDRRIVATKKPTSIPINNGANDLRLVKARTPIFD